MKNILWVLGSVGICVLDQVERIHAMLGRFTAAVTTDRTDDANLRLVGDDDDA